MMTRIKSETLPAGTFPKGEPCAGQPWADGLPLRPEIRPETDRTRPSCADDGRAHYRPSPLSLPASAGADLGESRAEHSAERQDFGPPPISVDLVCDAACGIDTEASMDVPQ